LAHYGITTPLLAYHEHNAELMRPKVMARLESGGRLAIVSDAGTPLVSDPGYKLVECVVEAGVPVTGIPGASAVLAALVLAGLPTDRFFFEGFLPPKTAARRGRLQELAAIPGTLVFFESPRRVAEMLADAAAIYGPRKAAVARELTNSPSPMPAKTHHAAKSSC
jgi:16S rRNA (cytidine1402-2'-O)-methyltransferase